MADADATRVRAFVVKQTVSIFDALQAVGKGVETATTQQIHCPNPAHPERRPSARVYEDSQHVHCFTCGKTWDAVGLVMTVKNLPFPDAIAWLEGVFGISGGDGLALVEAMVRTAPRQDLGPRFEDLSARLRAAKDRLPVGTYHAAWIVFDTTRVTWEAGSLDADLVEERLGHIESVLG